MHVRQGIRHPVLAQPEGQSEVRRLLAVTGRLNNKAVHTRMRSKAAVHLYFTRAQVSDPQAPPPDVQPWICKACSLTKEILAE